MVAGPGLILLLEDCSSVLENEPKGTDDDTAIGAPFTALDFVRCRESDEVLCVA